MYKQGDRIVESATEARQGRRGRPVFYILIAGVALVVVLYAAVYFGFMGHMSFQY